MADPIALRTNMSIIEKINAFMIVFKNLIFNNFYGDYMCKMHFSSLLFVNIHNF